MAGIIISSIILMALEIAETLVGSDALGIVKHTVTEIAKKVVETYKDVEDTNNIINHIIENKCDGGIVTVAWCENPRDTFHRLSFNAFDISEFATNTLTNITKAICNMQIEPEQICEITVEGYYIDALSGYKDYIRETFNSIEADNEIDYSIASNLAYGLINEISDKGFIWGQMTDIEYYNGIMLAEGIEFYEDTLVDMVNAIPAWWNDKEHAWYGDLSGIAFSHYMVNMDTSEYEEYNAQYCEGEFAR